MINVPPTWALVLFCAIFTTVVVKYFVPSNVGKLVLGLFLSVIFGFIIAMIEIAKIA